MKFHKQLWLTGVTLLAAIVLGACSMGATPVPTVDVGAAQTQAFSIVLTEVAIQQTETARAFPTAAPSATPFPTLVSVIEPTFPSFGENTSTPLVPIPGFTPLVAALPTIGVIGTVTTKNGCNDGTYLSESAPNDGEVLKGGGAYSKTWSILNVGTCVWDEGYTFELVTKYSSAEIKWEKTLIVIKKPEEYTKPQHSQAFVVKFTAPKAAGSYEAYWKLHDDSNNYFGPMVWLKFVVGK